mgnify:CR=1 FL=1
MSFAYNFLPIEIGFYLNVVGYKGVNYIRQGVDDLRVEIRSQGQRYDMLAERVTRVEESTKQAHKRIDKLELERGE